MPSPDQADAKLMYLPQKFFPNAALGNQSIHFNKGKMKAA